MTKNNTNNIAVLIPCYNEGSTIANVVRDWISALPNANIYVYDNNSTDNTAEEAQRAGAIVRHEYMQGKGNVVRRMFREIDADCYFMVDGDDTYPASPDIISQMADLVLNKQCDMVVGDRLSSTYFTENKRPFHNFGNSLVRLLVNRLFKSNIKDIMTGCRAFSYDFVKCFPVQSKGFEIETEMTVHAIINNMRVENVVIGYRDRPQGSESKLNTVKDGFKVLKTVSKLLKSYKPMLFFGVLSAILLLVAAAFFVPILSSYIKTGVVLRIPTLIVSGFIAVTGILSFFAGMILSTLQEQHRRAFEYQRQYVHDKRGNALCEKH